MPELPFRLTQLTGGPEEIGGAIGELTRSEVAAVVDRYLRTIVTTLIWSVRR